MTANQHGASDSCISFDAGEPECAEGVVRVRVAIDEHSVKVSETPFGLVVELGDWTAAGQPGEPALPRTSIYVAVPQGMWPTGVEVDAAPGRRLTDTPALVRPVQPLRAGQALAPAQGLAGDHEAADGCGPGGRPTHDRPREHDDDVAVEPFPHPALVAPDPELYAQAAKDTRIARPTAVDQIGCTPIVRVELHPLRLNDEGLLELNTEFDVLVQYAPRPTQAADPAVMKRLLADQGLHDIDAESLFALPEPTIVSRAQAKRDAQLARSLVVNPAFVVDISHYLGLRELAADYLVITSNQTWDADTIAPTGTATGDMVNEFRRLAAWKRRRGVTAKVVTIEDIVDGRYGDFRSSARDLPEVIRSFLKSVRERWGVAWVLLGGDVDVIPPRLVAGAREGHMDVVTENPPPDDKSFWTGSFLKMHVVSPGGWWPGNWPLILVNSVTGRRIPFDVTGASATSGLGWYYTTDNTYATRSATPTNFVRVNGPASMVNARMQWLYQWNRIPTDFYYASLMGYVKVVDSRSGPLRMPYVFEPAHDWDAVDNGLYGQYVEGADIDGVHWGTDVSVGRAPVQSADEAKTFVDKVIGYERFGTSRFVFDGEWPRRVLLASENWDQDFPITISPTASDPPEDRRFHADRDVTVIRLDAPARFDVQLIAEISDGDRRELPYNGAGSPSNRGWHYARSATDHTPNTLDLSAPWGPTLSLSWPSRWIVVHGPPEERNPRNYLTDLLVPDGSMVDQEALRIQLRSDLPDLDAVSRLYQDETDLTAVQRSAAPIAHLTRSRIQDAMNASPHIVSLSGHGSGSGCCGADVSMARALKNSRPFIVYADSCLTNQIDMQDAFGEELIRNPDGGAVAYVGNTRFSWIGLGDDFQRAFFRRLITTRHLGLLNDIRTYAADPKSWRGSGRWAIFALTLLGDPEMPVWRDGRAWVVPKVHWEPRDLRVPMKVRISKPWKGVDGVVVHISQGDFERVARPDRNGIVTFDLSGAVAGELTLTVSAPDAIPVVQTLTARGPVWTTGRVCSVSHGDETAIALQTETGEQQVLVGCGQEDHGVIVRAATEACVSGATISFLTDRHGGRVEGFRLLSPHDVC